MGREHFLAFVAWAEEAWAERPGPPEAHAYLVSLLEGAAVMLCEAEGGERHG